MANSDRFLNQINRKLENLKKNILSHDFVKLNQNLAILIRNCSSCRKLDQQLTRFHEPTSISILKQNMNANTSNSHFLENKTPIKIRQKQILYSKQIIT